VNKEQFLKIILPTASYYSKEMPSELITIYFNQAHEIDAEAFEFLINQHMKDSDQGRFFPTFAHLIAQAGTESQIKVEAGRLFEKNPLIDGYSSYDAQRESVEKRESRKRRFVSEYLEDWKDSTPIEKIAFSEKIPESYKIESVQAAKLLGCD
jgi:hypothetical protein